MIEIPTVLILGAGASHPYDFPLGEELKSEVCYHLSSLEKVRLTQIHRMGYNMGTILKFRNALFYSGKTSVDAFLEHRDEFIDVGKIAIAQALLPYEKTDALFSPSIREDWYKYLYNKLNAPFDKFEENKISIISFNYDRSIEHYLFTALINSYGKDPIDCAEKISKIPIIHIYGKLGDLPLMNDNNIPYDTTAPNIDQLTQAAMGIKIITEELEDDLVFERILELIINAKRVYFIGFGYNETNLNRLRLHSIPADYHKKIKFEGTMYGLSDQEVRNVIKYFRKYHLVIKEDIVRTGAYEFIREAPLE